MTRIAFDALIDRPWPGGECVNGGVMDLHVMGRTNNRRLQTSPVLRSGIVTRSFAARN
jgi:hypothetical protein